MKTAKTREMLREVLQEITPGNEAKKDVDLMLSRIRKEIKKRKINAKAVVGGSFAKGTFLKQDHDIDIFVAFNMKHAGDDLSEMLAKILKPMKPERIHGSRDYFKVRNSLNFEIVPVLGIKKPSDARNVTDFSPLHVQWVNKNGAKYKGDIRLAKKFCKANGIYGAESYINGLSGHVLDIIVIYYKGFNGLIKGAAKWKDKQVIDFYKTHRGKALFNLNKSKTEGPLVVIDPVQPDRNASAAFAKDKFERMVQAAKRFIRKPAMDSFAEKRQNACELKSRGAVAVEAVPVEGKEDIAGTKLLKAFEFLKKKLKDFGVEDSGWQWDRKKDALFWFFLKNKRLPEYYEREGPPLSKKTFADDFRKKHGETYERGGKAYAKLPRKNCTPEQEIADSMKDSYFRDKVKEARFA